MTGQKPSGREKQIINERKRKIDELRELGKNPYKHKFDKKNTIKDILLLQSTQLFLRVWEIFRSMV